MHVRNGRMPHPAASVSVWVNSAVPILPAALAYDGRVLRRILFIACVGLFALCAAGWAVGHWKTVEVSTDVGPATGIVFHRGACMVFDHRGTTAVREGRLVVEPHGLVHGDAWDWMYF